MNFLSVSTVQNAAEKTDICFDKKIKLAEIGRLRNFDIFAVGLLLYGIGKHLFSIEILKVLHESWHNYIMQKEKQNLYIF